MTSTIDYYNSGADWRFVVADVRGPDGSPYDLTGFTAAVTFRPDADRATGIQDCTSANGLCTIVPGAPGDPAATPPVTSTGPTIAILAPAASRSWRPTRPMLVVGDVMVSKASANPPSEDEVRRIAFVAIPGTTMPGV